MSFTSALYDDEIIIEDSTNVMDYDITPKEVGRGLNLDLRGAAGYEGVAEPFPSKLLIPRSEWQARIQEQEERKTRQSDIALQAELPCHDQDGIPYCWIHAPTYCMEYLRVLQGQVMVLLSATSVGCKIKNFQKQGGWGREGLQYIASHGVVPQSMWPENKLSKQYDTPEAWKKAKSFTAEEWWVLRARNLDEHISCLLHGIPVAVGLNYWEHEVTDTDAVWIDGAIAIRFRNSWAMSWGSKGFGIRQGSKMYADDAVAPRVATAA